jgi:sRNA-binding carbon storage regulator CsrA
MFIKKLRQQESLVIELPEGKVVVTCLSIEKYTKDKLVTRMAFDAPKEIQILRDNVKVRVEGKK